MLLLTLLLSGCSPIGSGPIVEFTPIDQNTPLAVTTVYTSGEEGYDTYRIPAIVRATDGSLLAFAEGRVENTRDWGNIDLVLKRSLDNGATWGPLRVVHEDGPNTVGNAAPVVDLATGRVVVVFIHGWGEDSELLINIGSSTGRKTAMLTYSDDHGETWAPARDISGWAMEEDWRWYAPGPGHALRLSRGPHAGRIVVAGNHTAGDWTSDDFMFGEIIYSDDGGATWGIGAVCGSVPGEIHPNEATAVQLTDGRIYINARNHVSDPQASRVFAHSSDGGFTFDNDFSLEPSITSPVVQASVLRYSAVDRGSTRDLLLYSGPAHPSQRREMRVRRSFDEAESWDAGKIIHAGPAAYSDLAITENSLVGVLFEAGDDELYERVDFATFGVLWLDEL